MHCEGVITWADTTSPSSDSAASTAHSPNSYPSGDDRGFTVPGYPVVPALSVLFCGYLIGNLPTGTYLLFAGWLAVALAVYLGYSRHHARLSHPRTVVVLPDPAAVD
ncbi:amino acid permease C-terminal domain-containing protein [Streptomyces demainii]|uniref:amino acid permease C-terminal domain-containing protein n=1 Tax=Streptomyces demainii TaxID=588122 RepID=UPI0027D92F09|nr:amino acid permease C-terminal domain-containing protein [Streptomyces demainii]